ncbi:MAG: stage II sporulation protein M [Steroidobacteraceae bacterium]
MTGPELPATTDGAFEQRDSGAIAQHAEQMRRGTATPAEAIAVLHDYRQLAQQLARVRRAAPRGAERDRLESAYLRLHGIIHRPAIQPRHWPLLLFGAQLPATVWALRKHIAWVALLFVLSIAAGHWLTQSYPDLVALFASPQMVATVERGELWTDSLLNVFPGSVLSAEILTNNVVVALFAYCAGFLFGLGTFYIVTLNGLLLGSLFAFTSQHGIADRLFAFIIAHGPVELGCVCLAGAAGAAVGEAIARPPNGLRSDAFRSAIARTWKLMLVLCILLIGCGFIEGFISPNPGVSLAARITIGAGYFLCAAALLLLPRRWRRSDTPLTA